MPADGWPSSCYLLEAAGERVLFDCGPGAATALSKYVAPSELSAVFLSHRHLDHCFDLVVVGKQLLYASLASDGADVRRVPLYVPVGVGDVLRRLNHVLPIGDVPESNLDNVFDTAFALVEYEPGEALVCGPIEVTPVAMRHRIPSHGFRAVMPDGRVFAFSGDTGPTPAFDTLAGRADLLLCEATLDHADAWGDGHMSAAEAGAAAGHAGVRELVLTHLISSEPSWIAAQRAAAAEHFGGPIYVATPGAQFLVAPFPSPAQEA